MKPVQPQDHGTPERHKQSPVIQVALESERLPVAKALIECVLDRYQERSQISDRQHEAGIRIRHLWRKAVLPASTTGAYGPAVSGGGDSADTADARQKLANALLGAPLATRIHDRASFLLVLTRNGSQVFPEKLPWRLLPIGHIVIAVCGFDEWAGGTLRLVHLREGLTALADYWQIEH